MEEFFRERSTENLTSPKHMLVYASYTSATVWVLHHTCKDLHSMIRQTAYLTLLLPGCTRRNSKPYYAYTRLVSHTVKTNWQKVKNERSCSPLFIPFLASWKFELVCKKNNIFAITLILEGICEFCKISLLASNMDHFAQNYTFLTLTISFIFKLNGEIMQISSNFSKVCTGQLYASVTCNTPKFPDFRPR